jgi:hypothetical protein
MVATRTSLLAGMRGQGINRESMDTLLLLSPSKHKSCIQTTTKFVCSMSRSMKYEVGAMLITK